MKLDSLKSVALGGERGRASSPRWSRDGQWIAYIGAAGLTIARPDGTGETPLAKIEGTNHPLPASGDRIAWSPDSKQIAFISSSPGPEADANGDPMMITRYLYKPTASEGLTRFNDNRRLHIFIVDIAARSVRQLTTGQLLRAFDRLVARRPGDSVRLESRARSGSLLQLRYFRRRFYHRFRPPAHRYQERRVSPRLVARRKDHRVSGHTAHADFFGNHHGRHPHLGHGCRRLASPRARHGNRQSPGRAEMVRGRQVALLRRAGARVGSSLSRAGRRRSARAHGRWRKRRLLVGR